MKNKRVSLFTILFPYCSKKNDSHGKWHVSWWSVGYQVVKVLNKFSKSWSSIFHNGNGNDNGSWVLQPPVSISFWVKCKIPNENVLKSFGQAIKQCQLLKTLDKQTNILSSSHWFCSYTPSTKPLVNSLFSTVFILCFVATWVIV